MRRRRILIGVAGTALLVAAALFAGTGAPDAPTTFSVRPRGLAACYTYLERRGYPVTTWQRDYLRLPEPPGLMVLAAPFRIPVSVQEYGALDGWIRRGGHFLLLTDSTDQFGVESMLLSSFGLPKEEVPPDPPLGPLAWRRWYRRTLEMEAAAGSGIDLSLPAVVRAGRERVIAPRGAATLLASKEDGSAMGFRLDRGMGALLVINNSSVWANAWIERGGNLALLEQVVGSAAASTGRVWFDEWHHGHRAALADAGGGSGSLLLLVAHLGLLYLAAAWTISRPFGPRLAADALHAGSVHRNLLGVASLHRAARHAPDAGRALLERARRLAARKGVAVDLPERFEGGDREFIELARHIGQLKRKRKL